jgi:hypothetical protein
MKRLVLNGGAVGIALRYALYFVPTSEASFWLHGSTQTIHIIRIPYTYTYIHIHIYICTYTCIHMHMQIHIRIHKHRLYK